MAIDFSVEPEFQEQLDWVRAFVHDEVEPIEHVWSMIRTRCVPGTASIVRCGMPAIFMARYSSSLLS